MIGKLTGTILSGSLAAAAATLGLGFTTASNAQPYYERSYDQPTYADESPASVGEIVVTPEYRGDRTINGIPTRRIYASRVVRISDLDLSTGWGVHVLRQRVQRAAASACEQLDNEYPAGLRPVDSNDSDCQARAVRRAMADAPIGESVDTDYRGY